DASIKIGCSGYPYWNGNDPVRISAAPDLDASISIAAFGSAESPADFRLLNNTLIFPAGQTGNQNVEIELYEDVSEEADETIELSFTVNLTGSNAVAGNQVSTSITIRDDDVAPDAATAKIATAANINGGFADFNLGPNTTVHFYDQVNGNLMLSVINPTSHDYGCTNVSIDRADEDNPGATISDVGEVDFVTDKTFFISPEVNNFSANFTVRLYYTANEIRGFLSEAGREENDIRVYKSDIDVPSEMNVLEMRFPTVVDFGQGAYYEATYNTGMAGFALGVEAATLPVELVNFMALAGEKNIELSWLTLSETDNAGFTILRKGATEAAFVSLGWVPALDNVAGGAYQFVDRTAIPGVTYAYQLQQRDNDGTITLSEIVTAQIEDTNLRVDAYPNPAGDLLMVRIASASSATIKLVGTDGRVVKRIDNIGEEGIGIDLSQEPAGVYLLVVEMEAGVVVKKVLRE
ncbi:MAG: T9SS type A sorting domain-containing protein, partial [Bacteroidota bacterium]